MNDQDVEDLLAVAFLGAALWWLFKDPRRRRVVQRAIAAAADARRVVVDPAVTHGVTP